MGPSQQNKDLFHTTPISKTISVDSFFQSMWPTAIHPEDQDQTTPPH